MEIMIPFGDQELGNLRDSEMLHGGNKLGGMVGVVALAFPFFFFFFFFAICCTRSAYNVMVDILTKHILNLTKLPNGPFLISFYDL
jgi:hypothetical protein